MALDWQFQPGEPRTREQTLQEVERQLKAAMLGVEATVTAMQTESGVKDAMAQYWIDRLLVRGRELSQKYMSNQDTRDTRLNSRTLTGDARKAVQDEIREKIREEQWDWLVQQPAHRYAELPPGSGKCKR